MGNPVVTQIRKTNLNLYKKPDPVFVRNSKERVPRGSNVVLRNIRFKALDRRFFPSPSNIF